jgi:hypothetical protein
MELRMDPALVAAASAPRAVFPMPNGQYVASNGWLYANKVALAGINHRLFTGWVAPPSLGQTINHTFESQVELQYSSDGGAHFSPVRAPATATVTVKDVREFQGRTTCDTEMTMLNIAGGGLPAGVMIRESPTKASQGGTSSLAGGGGGGAGGGAAISSFFDIFTEISTDGGTSWSEATNGPAYTELSRIAPVELYVNNLLPPLCGRYVSPPERRAAFSPTAA